MLYNRHAEVVAPGEGDRGNSLGSRNGEAGQSSVMGTLICREVTVRWGGAVRWVATEEETNRMTGSAYFILLPWTRLLSSYDTWRKLRESLC